MKRLLSFGAVLCVVIPFSAAGSWFDAYTAGDYARARGVLEQHLLQHPSDPLIHYNLGVVAEKEGRRGAAVYHYLQALQAAPAFKEARNNLEALTGELHVTIPSSLLDQSGDLWWTMILFFVTFYLFTAVLLWHLLRPNWKRRLALVPIVMLMALFAFLFASRYHAQTRLRYAVAQSAQTLRSGPDSALSGVGTVREGEIVEIGDTSGEWTKIRGFQDNIEGWVPSLQVRHIIRRIE